MNDASFTNTPSSSGTGCPEPVRAMCALHLAILMEPDVNTTIALDVRAQCKLRTKGLSQILQEAGMRPAK